MTSTVDRHLHWGAESLWRRLEPLLPGLSVEVLAQAESTNTMLLERARATGGSPDAPVTRPGDLDAMRADERTPLGRRVADVQPCLLVAEHQTRGRGRLGRDWVSSAGASLTFSLSLPLSPSAWSGLSLAVGLALADALEPPTDDAAAPRIGLKWPNDLCLRDAGGGWRKLGGVLIETVSVGSRRMCVVGVGINVAPQETDEILSQGCASLREIDPDCDAPGTLARIAEPLVRALVDFERRGFAVLEPAYRRRDVLLGLAVTTTQPEVPAGIADGVDESGALRVRCGDVHRIVGGEVSVRPAATPT